MYECESVNPNDTWHAIKSVKSSLKKISTWPAYLEGKTCSNQLDDKVDPVCTHFHWAIRNCDKNVSRLQAILLNTVEQYKNNHLNCHPSSRCKKDPNYEISRIVITDPKDEKILLGVIKNSLVYKHPEDYAETHSMLKVSTMSWTRQKDIFFWWYVPSTIKFSCLPLERKCWQKLHIYLETKSQNA